MTCKHSFVAVSLMVTAISAWGAASRQRPIEVAVPGGGTATVVAVGDEHCRHYINIADGSQATWIDSRGSQKSFVPMHRPDLRSRATQSRVTTFPTLGERHFLVVMVEFADMSFSAMGSQAEIDAMFNAEAYSSYGGTGSVADYYIDNSAGQFLPYFDVVGPVKMTNGYAYYGSGSDDSRAGLMVVEACKAIDDMVNFADYDLDGDGEVDSVYFIYAGKGEADGGDTNTIWPHSWNLSDQSRELTLDGVAIQGYACSPELDGAGKLNGMGTPCHEFSHVLGLPDLYCTNSYVECLHPYDFSLMARGNYLNDGRTPPAMSSYERYELGWIEPRVLSFPLDVTLAPLSQTNEACRLDSERQNEYFLLENRQKSGWDTYLPAHGMLVWHIDYNANIWDRNRVNATPTHQYVDIVEANGATSFNQASGFTFPGTAKVTEFTASTRPALVSWAGEPINLPLTAIKESADGYVSFKVAGGKTPIGNVKDFRTTQVGMESIVLQWSAAVEAQGYKVRVSSGNEVVAELETGETDASIGGLWPGNTYIAAVCAYDAYEQSDWSEIVVTMPEPTFAYLKPSILPPVDVTPSSFVACWEPLTGAVSYNIEVGERIRGEAIYDVCDFTGKVLPEGFSTTVNTWVSMAGNYGAAAPSLRLLRSEDFLLTPTYADGINELSLWLKGNNSEDGGRLIIEALNASNKVLKQIIVTPTDTPQVVRFTAADTEIPAECVALKILLDKGDGKTTINIDDVTIGHGANVLSEIFINERSAEGTTEFNVCDKVLPMHRYYYRVTGINAEGCQSQTSAEIELETPEHSGVGVVGCNEESPVVFYNMSGMRIERPAAGIYIEKRGNVATLRK